jgi:CRP-like cAMP-binding protein
MYDTLFVNFIKENIPNISFDNEAISSILCQFETVKISKGDFLLKQGNISDYYFIADGFLRVFTFDTDGNEVTTYFYTNHRIVFDAASFFSKTPSNENIQAMTDCNVYKTNFDKLNKLFHTVPAFREFARQIMVQEFVAYKNRTVAMINQSAEKRYLKLIETNKDIFQFAQLSQIASYLGVSERTLNRIRRNFSKKK